jgi:hypothetical protein
MLGVMDSARLEDGPRPRAGQAVVRRGPLIAEILVLVAFSVADSVPFLGGPADRGLAAAL